MRLAFVTGLATAALAACVAPAADPADPVDPDPMDPVDPMDPPPVPTATGAYKLRTSVEITAEVLLPQQIANAVDTLRSFSTHPARTMMDLAEAEGVPAVGTLRDALPDSIESMLEDWLDEQIHAITIGGYPITAYAGDMASLAETALGRFTLESELALDGATATHRLVGLDLHPIGIAAVIPLDQAGDVLTQTAALSTTPTSLALGDHTFGLAYGRYIWQGVEGASQEVYGGTIRQALGSAISCTAIAQAVSEQCLAGQCVGHQAELTSLCEAGLDYVVAYVRDRVVALRIDALRLATGTARLVDADRDLSVEALADGTWGASLNLGMGLRQAPATFTGTR